MILWVIVSRHPDPPPESLNELERVVGTIESVSEVTKLPRSGFVHSPDDAVLRGAPEPRRSHVGSSSPSERGAAARERPVALNRADAAELRRLPGVGAKRAEAILLLRQRLGRFRKPTDQLRIKGIGPRTLERMLPLLVLD